MASLLFAGVPRFALALLEAGHELRAVCLPWLDEDDETWALVHRCTREGIPMFPGAALTADASDEEREALHALGPYDVVLVMSFERRIEAWARALGTRGAWNVHPSLLPRHRGYNPYFWTVFHGDEVSGVTLHEMTQRFDAGKILTQVQVDVPKQGTSGQLWERLQDASETMILDVLARLDDGDTPLGQAQDESLATPARKPREADLVLNLDAAAADVVRHVRAATPEPGALLRLGDELFIVRGAVEGPTPPRGTRAGELFVHGGFTYVATAQGSFRPFNLERGDVTVELKTLMGAA